MQFPVLLLLLILSEPLPTPYLVHLPKLRFLRSKRKESIFDLQMALIQLGSVSGTSAVQLSFLSSVSPPLTTKVSLSFQPEKKSWRNRRMICRAMVQEAVQGIPLVYAREMERLSAKESLILAFNDAGGFEDLVTGKITDIQRIDVNERITSLERLNPTSLERFRFR
ncbi:PREDICTED: probable plastid-lipid-associated protein 9, chloroplastic [Camelina sativa]|uniref:Probable plastid-lipid-associated protein 9, chloroplastic n=1 Tax=Camelina sativa TaxID=90675 RepID=A0ABM1R6R8_CAMSA|nr:PREDICTED: probable plastid-lipid-associated protein 9, chloroplastic [Camelina sativa]